MKRSLCVMAVALGMASAQAQLPSDIIRAQVPEIHEIAPATPQAGEIVRIFGQNFDRTPTNNIVHFAGARAQVLRSWVSELEVQLPPAVQPGPVTVVVSNKLALSEVPFQPRFIPFGATNPVYARTVSFEGARHPAAVDLDNDGKLELIAARNPNRIEIYRYVGSGPLLNSNSFSLVASLSGFTNTASMRYLDLYSDGKYDLFVASTNSGARVLANFNSPGEIATNNFGFYSVPGSLVSDFADVDRDGTLDLITLMGTSVYGIRGLPRGSHETFSGSTLISGNRVVSGMAVGDLNRDGHIDIVALDPIGMRIYSHDGRVGNMSAFIEVSIPATQYLDAVQIADIEGDGWLDILVFNQSTWQCEVFWNRNVGGHLSAEDFTRVTLIGRERSRLVTPRLLDLDGDSFPDLLTLFSTYHKNESALLGEIIFPGSFATTNRSGISFNSPLGIISADLNADGLPEIITDECVVYQNISAMVPLITSAYFGVDGAYYFTIHGRANESISVQRSTDLSSWTTIRKENLSSNGMLTYWAGEPLEPARFFRVVTP